ncbi:CheR family methyltransferase [Ramlibacter sp. PS3R-8]|uniref:CheR family methyltransferase n=1 Tax=Ramlibacter sp. PS3R-8 TaxID=3133437 RepID=UPI0030AA9ACC
MSAAVNAEGSERDATDDVIPSDGDRKVPLVGLGGSAGSIEALQAFFNTMPARSGLAFVVVIHLAPDHHSILAELIQRCTPMRVVKVEHTLTVEPDAVYVIPPGKLLQSDGDELKLVDIPEGRARHVTVDMFFRTLADSHGAHAAAVVLSGMDGDGSIGIKRIKERGGLTVAQDPGQAMHASMPRTAIDTGMVDWVLPVQDMPARLLAYFRLESAITLPPEEPPRDPSAAGAEETGLRDVLNFMQARTGRDFSFYKRATMLRRLARRMRVNGVDNLAGYLICLRTRPGECQAFVQDLLISVTNFFRDPECFAALETQIPALFAGKGPGDAVRVWVVACATGEEAYSIAMLLSEHARTLDAPPLVQVFATDLDERAVQVARDAVYPPAIEADVSEERLRRFFMRESRGYRVRRELRETVLFAAHDVLHTSPFSRQDMVSCRNLLIYLNREAQQRVFETLHFSLLPHGKLFLGSSESMDEGSPLFSVVDKKHRIYQQRPSTRNGIPLTDASETLAKALESQNLVRAPLVTGHVFDMPPAAGADRPPRGHDMPRAPSAWSETHLHLLERLAPPSLVVDADYDIVHLSPSAGRFLQLAGGAPSHNLLHAMQADVRLELRAALLQAAQRGVEVRIPVVNLAVAGGNVATAIRVVPAREVGETLFVVLFEVEAGPETAEARAARLESDPLARHLDAEIERLKSHLRETVEQYEASSEELKASNEELQAMNEEMRAATEELETSREELQSINEELATVNQELKTKVEQLSHSNSDMQNLMDATQIATIFLDRELRITRFTPAAVQLFNLIPGDIGRPLTDMAAQIDYPQLGADARRVLGKLVPIEREVGHADGSWFLARLMPYRTVDDHIAGVVFTFIDITERKQAEEVRMWLSAVVTSTSDAIISFGLDGTIVSWNNGAQRLFGYTVEEAVGRPMAMLSGEGADGHDVLMGQLGAGLSINNFETVRRRKDGSQVHVALTMSPIQDAEGRVLAGTVIARDITATRAAAEALRQSEERLRLILENAVEYAIFSTDLERRVTSWNTGAERLLGFRSEEMLGDSADVIFTPEDRAARGPEKEAATARREGRAADERFHQRKDGSRFRGTGIMMLMRNQAGEAVGLVKILRDLTRPEPDPE